MDISQLIKVTAAGVTVASFSEIRGAVVERYQSAYGSDIDLSTGSADGVFVNDLCLIINNILQTVNNLYSNLDVNSASGVYLDALCRLSNVTRKGATNSSADLTISNPQSTDVELRSNTQFVDKSGVIWLYQGNPVTIEPSGVVSIQVVCTQSGPIVADAGWISNTVEPLGLNVVQATKAELGSTIESDSDLRNRRAQSSGSAGITVLQSLSGALLNLAGIEDVLIYDNNQAEEDITITDATVLPHSIYVIIRQSKNVNIADNVIGNIIYNKLTPGIRTSKVKDNVLGGKQYDYTPSATVGAVVPYSQKISWKQANFLSPKITITLQTKSFFVTSEVTAIVKELVSYLNALRINQTIDVTEVVSVLLDSDPMFKNNRTYTVTTANIEVAEHFNVNDCYLYDVDSYEEVERTPETFTFSIGEEVTV